LFPHLHFCLCARWRAATVAGGAPAEGRAKSAMAAETTAAAAVPVVAVAVAAGGAKAAVAAQRIQEKSDRMIMASTP